MTKSIHRLAMNGLAIKISGLLLMLSSSVLQAATVIEVQSSNDLATVVTDGQFARMNMSGSEYVIVDYKKQTVKVVNPQKQEVMLLAADKTATGNNGPLVRTAINKLGAGIKVAGYPTQKYSYSANGRPCGVIYGSRDVYQQQGIKELLDAMEVMIEQQRAALGGFASLIDDCTLADMNVNDHVKTIGVPMRTEKNGRVETEIKSIKQDVAIAPDTFVIPASYKTLTIQDPLKAASQGMANKPPQMQRRNTQNMPPQAQEMMRQMQQSGRLTPEMMEQMRRNQEMMRQYQQRGYR